MAIRSDEWFNLLYRKNALNMVKLATRLLGNEEIAKELVHEAFVILICKEDYIKKHPNPDGWLFQTLKNLIMNEMQLTKYKVELPLFNIEAESMEFSNETSLLDWLPKQLTKDEQTLLVWYYEQQLSYEDIASRLDISVLACRTRLFRAKEKCKKYYDKNYDYV